MVGHPIRILGIDPGLRRTGWGLVEADGNRLIYVACGSLETSERAALGDRLVVIHDGLVKVIEQYRPHEAAVEATFVNANAVATLKLGQARGIAMLVPAKAGLTVAEYAPNVVKKNRGRRRPRREGADPHDDRRAAAEGRSAERGRRRRAGDRGLSRASPDECDLEDESCWAMTRGAQNVLPPPCGEGWGGVSLSRACGLPPSLSPPKGRERRRRGCR